MRKVSLLVASSLLLLTTACGLGSSSPSGLSLVGNTMQAETRYTSTAIGPKTGKACLTNYLGIYASGDNSVQAAAKAGGIRRITSVDYNIDNMIIVGTACTVVTGE